MNFFKKIWSSKLNRAIIITLGIVLISSLISVYVGFFTYIILLGLLALCIEGAIKSFIKPKNENNVREFFPQTNNLKENLREEREENSNKLNRTLFGSLCIVMAIVIIFMFVRYVF